MSSGFSGSKVLVLGNALPAAFLHLDREVSLCPDTSFRVAKLLRKAANDFSEITAVHAYDRDAAVLGSWVAIALGVPLVVTKPGGERPLASYPLFKNMVVVQGSDFDAIVHRKAGRPKSLTLIANRIALRPIDGSRSNPFSGCADGAWKLLCIARITPEYTKTISQAIRLAQTLRQQGLRVALRIVGDLSDEAVFGQVSKLLNSECDEILTGREFISDAFELLPFCDAVVGAGRVAMEAMGEGKLTFVPAALGPLPCFLWQRTYSSSFYENFSDRAYFGPGEVQKSIALFLQVISMGERAAMHREWMRSVFFEDLDVQRGIHKLAEVYDEAEKERVLDKLGFFLARTLAHVKAKLRRVQSRMEGPPASGANIW